MTLSNDECFEIFSWLPATTIYRLKSNYELLLEFLEETYFASKQAQKALLRDDTHFIIQSHTIFGENIQLELHPLPGEELLFKVCNDFIGLLNNSVKILSSSNGLILYQVIGGNQVKLFICNPATLSWLPLPIIENLHWNIGVDLKVSFQCDSDGNYVVILFYDNSIDWSSYMNCKVYSSKEGVWKAREERFFIGGRNLRFDMPVHHNDVIHFISDCFPYFQKNSPYFNPYIVSYNFEDGKSRMLRLPKEARKSSHDYTCDMRIFNWGKVTCANNQSICLVRLRKRVFTIWVLTNYELCLWRKILKVRVKAMGVVEKDPIVKGFAILNSNLLVFITEEKVYGYCLTNMRIQELCEHGSEFMIRIIPYSDTLRACGAAGVESFSFLLHL